MEQWNDIVPLACGTGNKNPLPVSPVLSALAVTYRYDDRNHLIEADFDDGTFIVYTYDANGNRTGKTLYEENGRFPITAGCSPGGTVSPSSASVGYLGSQTFRFTAATGYTLT